MKRHGTWAVILLTGAVAVPIDCSAGRINGTIVELTQQVVNGIPAVLVVTTGGVEEPLASCHVGTVTRMWINQTTEHGRSMATLANLAFVTGNFVRIGGTGSCTVQPEVETAEFFIVV